MICRLCVSEVTDIIQLFNCGNETEYLKIITRHMNLELKEDDKHSTDICKTCAERLMDWKSFCQFVEERQLLLCANTFEVEIPIEQAKLDQVIADNKTFTIGTDYKSEICGTSDQKQKQERGDSPMQIGSSSRRNLPFVSTADEQPRIFNPTSDYNKELCEALNEPLMINKQDFQRNDDSLDFCCNTDDETNDGKDKVDILTNQLHEKAKRPKLLNDINDQSVKSKSKRKIKTRSTRTDKRCNKIKTEVNKSETNKDLTEGELHEKIIGQHMTIKCEICNGIEQSFMKLQMHYRLKHGCKGYLKCCGKLFEKRHRLADHIKLHLNPEAFQCQYCKKSLHSKSYLRRHIEDRHSNIEQQKYNCEICGKKFANKSTFHVHRKSHNTEKPFKCDKCDKAFKHKGTLEGHVKSMHEEHYNPFVCDICGRGYRFKPSFDKHVAEHKGIVLSIHKKCEICGDIYTRYDRHMDKHNHIDVTCNICGKVSTSKAGLRGHMEQKHRKSTKEPIMHSCTFCEKTFTRKKSLKEHTTIHTDEKLYSCKHCHREFRSKANMYTHIKRSHVNEWMEAKLAAESKKKLHKTIMDQDSCLQDVPENVV